MTPTVDLAFPFTRRWVARKSPADRYPSHGSGAFASGYAIDFVPVDDAGRSAPIRLRTLFRPEPPELFPGFGRDVLSPVDGEVVEAADDAVDHPAHRGLPSILYALTQSRRTAAGWPALAGNRVLIRTASGAVVALCHLRRHSVVVCAGQIVRRGQLLGQCGNSGNSTEPHVHVQAMDQPDPARARPLPLRFDGVLPRGGHSVDT